MVNISKLDKISDLSKEQLKHRHTVTNLVLVIYLVAFQDREVFLQFFTTVPEECQLIGLMGQLVQTNSEDKRDLEVMHKIHKTFISLAALLHAVHESVKVIKKNAYNYKGIYSIK